MAHVSVYIEVDLARFDTDDLVDELESRNSMPGQVNAAPVIPPLNSEETHPLHEIYYAFKFGLTERATELARAYVCDELGVVL